MSVRQQHPCISLPGVNSLTSDVIGFGLARYLRGSNHVADQGGSRLIAGWTFDVANSLLAGLELLGTLGGTWR